MTEQEKDAASKAAPQSNKPDAAEVSAILDEALMPELSDDYFDFEGIRIQIKLLTIANQKLFEKAINPFLDKITLCLSYSGIALNDIATLFNQASASGDDQQTTEIRLDQLAAIVKGLVGNVDIMAELVRIIINNDGHPVTAEQMDNSTMQPEEMQRVIATYFKKRNKIESHVADFFLRVLPALEGIIADLLKNVNDEMSKLTTTSLSKAFVNATDGQSSTSRKT